MKTTVSSLTFPEASVTKGSSLCVSRSNCPTFETVKYEAWLRLWARVWAECESFPRWVLLHCWVYSV